jgi:hypothetical protein
MSLFFFSLLVAVGSIVVIIGSIASICCLSCVVALVLQLDVSKANLGETRSGRAEEVGTHVVITSGIGVRIAVRIAVQISVAVGIVGVVVGIIIIIIAITVVSIAISSAYGIRVAII